MYGCPKCTEILVSLDGDLWACDKCNLKVTIKTPCKCLRCEREMKEVEKDKYECVVCKIYITITKKPVNLKAVTVETIKCPSCGGKLENMGQGGDWLCDDCGICTPIDDKKNPNVFCGKK